MIETNQIPKQQSSNPRILITGACGFIGQALSKKLLSGNYEVIGIGQSSSHPLSDLEASFFYHQCDLNSEEKLRSIILESHPQHVFHLAAQASVARSWEKPQETFIINQIGTLTLSQILKELDHPPRLLLASTGEIYGDLSSLKIITEEQKPDPKNPYALSKYFSELTLFQNYENSLIARFFPITGPGQSDKFVIPSFCHQAAKIKKSLQEAKIVTGNIQVKRSFLNIEDAINGLMTLMFKGRSKEIYNMGSSHPPVKLKEILDWLKEYSGHNFITETNPKLLRKNDIINPPQINCEKLKNLGWQETIPLKQTIEKVFLSFL